MKPGEVVRVCSKQATLLNMKQATLESNWRAFEAAFQPTPTAKVALVTALRGGRCHFIALSLETARWGPASHVHVHFGLLAPSLAAALSMHLWRVCQHWPAWQGICFAHRSATPCREKVAQLQQLFHVPDNEVPRFIGNMAWLMCHDIAGTVQPRLAFLQGLTGETKYRTGDGQFGSQAGFELSLAPAPCRGAR